MNPNQTRIVGAIVFYVLIFASGYWISNKGKPYSTLVFTLHKLISLAAVALLVVTMIQVDRETGLGAGAITAGVVTGLFFVGTMATGGMLSVDKPMPAFVSLLHKITPFLTVLSTAVTMYLINK